MFSRRDCQEPVQIITASWVSTSSVRLIISKEKLSPSSWCRGTLQQILVRKWKFTPRLRSRWRTPSSMRSAGMRWAGMPKSMSPPALGSLS